MKALFRGRKGNVAPGGYLEAAGYAGVPQPSLRESIRLWQQAEEAERRGT